MKTRFLALLVAVFVIIGLASAQSYSIRITYNTNLRVAGSLQSNIVETAPAGTILNVIGSANRWLQISRNGHVWMADWVGYTRVEQTAPTQTQTQTVSNIDNCCFVDRQCNTDQQWERGYFEFQIGYCTEPTESQAVTSSRVDNCCFVDRQCNTDAEWTSGYVAWQRHECVSAIDNCCQLYRECHTDEDWQRGAQSFASGGCNSSDRTSLPVQASTQPVLSTATVIIPEGVDNCCQVNRQCHTDDDWVRGFNDFRSNQCAGAAPTTSNAPIAGPIPEGVDNCCFVNWECHSEQDYVSGYERFKHNLCYVPSIEGGINLDGSAAFRGRIKEALQLLLNGAPKWYAYVINGLHVIRERPGRSASVTSQYGVMKVDPNRYNTYDLAAVIVHEACHAHRYSAGLETGGYKGERDCTTKEIEVLRIFGSGSPELHHEEWLLANMFRAEHQWWRD